MNDTKFTKALIIHHTDCDGLTGAKICEQGIKKKYPTVTEFNYVPAAYYTKLYIRPEHITNETLFVIVDFSLPIDMMDELLEKVCMSQIIWIDHHVSVIEEYSRYPKNVYLKGLRVPHGVCGAELAYAYFFLDACQREYGTDEFYIGSDRVDTNDPISLNKFFERIPEGLKYVGDWDVWRWVNDPNETGRYMNCGFYMLAPKIAEDSEFWRIFYDRSTNGGETLRAVILNGEIIARYQDKQNKGLCKRFAFPARLEGCNLDVVSLNSAVHNSNVFKVLFDLYEIGIIYHFTGDLYVFSIYRLGKNPEKEIDVSKIASVFGGGGHHDVAGFELKDTRVLSVCK